MSKEQRTGKRSKIALKCALLLGSTLIALLAAEVSLRIIWHNPYLHEKSDRIVKLRLQHGDADHFINRSTIDSNEPIVRFRVNERSYILPANQYDDPDYTIAFLGGSTTECCAVTEPLRFPALVSTELAKEGIEVSTLNAGTSGNTLHDSVNLLINHVEQDRPDIAVVMHACNDIGLLEHFNNYSDRSGEHLDVAKVTRATLMFTSNYSYVLALGRQALKEHTHFVPTNPDDLLALPELQYSDEVDGAYERRLRVFVRSARAFGIEPVVMTQPISTHYTELSPSWLNQTTQARFNDIVRRVGDEENVTVIDLVEHLEKSVPDWDSHLNVFYDGIHVTDNGSQIYGKHIAKILGELIRDMESNGQTRQQMQLTDKPRSTTLR